MALAQGNTEDVNEQLERFKTDFNAVANCHAPLIQKKVPGIGKCPWMNSEIKHDIRERNYFFFEKSKEIKSRRGTEWKNYRTLRNRVTRKIRKAKEAYNRKLFEENIMPNKQQTTSTSIKVNGQHCTDKHTIANAINNYFISIVSRLLSSVGLNKAARNKESLQESRHPTFKFQLVTE